MAEHEQLRRFPTGFLAGLTVDRLIFALFVLAVFTRGALLQFDSDSWWHLRTGQLIWQTGHVWLTDPFSSTAQGAYWPNHEWLTQVIFYGGYLLMGYGFPVLFAALVITATWVIIYHLCAGPPLYRALVLVAALNTHVMVWIPRPHIVTLLFFVLTLLLIREYRFRWLLPPLFLLWANMHGGVAFGGSLLVVTTIIALVLRRPERWHWVGITLASGLLTLLTPLGGRLWGFTLGMLDHPFISRYIQEWQPPSLFWSVSYPFFAVALLWLFVVVLRRDDLRALWRRDQSDQTFWTMLLLVLGIIYLLLGFKAIRHTPLFASVALPFILAPETWRRLPTLTRLAARLSQERVSVRRGMLHLALLTGAVAGALFFIALDWSEAKRWHALPPDVVAAVRSCPGTLYNTHKLGGHVMWAIPGRPVFVDSRNDPYTDQHLIASVEAEFDGVYRELFAHYDVRCALVPIERPLYEALRQDPAWMEHYTDDEYALFQRAP
jgi:hypothetical protein